MVIFSGANKSWDNGSTLLFWLFIKIKIIIFYPMAIDTYFNV